MTPSMMMFILKFSLVFTQRVIWLMASGVMFASVKPPSFKLSFRLFLKHPSCWQRVRQSEPWPRGSASTLFFIPRESEESIFCGKTRGRWFWIPKKIQRTFLMVATASFTSATSLGSSKMPSKRCRNLMHQINLGILYRFTIKPRFFIGKPIGINGRNSVQHFFARQNCGTTWNLAMSTTEAQRQGARSIPGFFFHHFSSWWLSFNPFEKYPPVN